MLTAHNNGRYSFFFVLTAVMRGNSAQEDFHKEQYNWRAPFFLNILYFFSARHILFQEVFITVQQMN